MDYEIEIDDLEFIRKQSKVFIGLEDLTAILVAWETMKNDSLVGYLRNAYEIIGSE